MVAQMGRRVDVFIRIMRLSGVPLQRGEGLNRYALQGIPGFAFRFAGRGLFSNGHGQPNVNVQRMLAILAREGMPVTVQHHAGSPYDEAIVSMYARDWARLMVAFIDTDPERYSIQKKGSQA